MLLRNYVQSSGRMMSIDYTKRKVISCCKYSTVCSVTTVGLLPHRCSNLSHDMTQYICRTKVTYSTPISIVVHVTSHRTRWRICYLVVCMYCNLFCVVVGGGNVRAHQRCVPTSFPVFGSFPAFKTTMGSNCSCA